MTLLFASTAHGGVQQASPASILLMMGFFIILIGGGVYLALWRWRTAVVEAAIEPATPTGFCRQCGNSMTSIDKFCPDCGCRVRKRVEP
jgi:tRNA(Ile2) C34 agmatinyltransferase TiaS